MTSGSLAVVLALISTIGAEAIIESFKYEPFLVAPDPAEEFLPFGAGVGRSFAFANRQGSTYGSRVRLVNTSRGNLTFEWRDIVLPGALAFHVGRVYDSEWVEGHGVAGVLTRGDFGPGWRLRPGDFLLVSRAGASLTLYPDTGTSIEFERGPGGSFRLQVDAPGPWIEIVPAANGRLEAKLRGGVRKTFAPGVRRGLYLLETIRDPNGNWLRLSWHNDQLQRVENDAGAFVEVVRAGKRNASRSHDSAGDRVTEIRDSAERTVHFHYDRAGNLIDTLAPGEIRTAFTYGPVGRLSSVSDGMGRLLFGATYDQEGRVKRFRRYPGDIEFRYEKSSASTIVRSALGYETGYFHDNIGRTIRIVDPLGNENRVAYGRAGDPIEYQNAFGKITRYTYANHLLKGITYPDGSSLRYEHDPQGRLVSAVDPLGNETVFQYDSRGCQHL